MPEITNESKEKKSKSTTKKTTSPKSSAQTTKAKSSATNKSTTIKKTTSKSTAKKTTPISKVNENSKKKNSNLEKKVNERVEKVKKVAKAELEKKVVEKSEEPQQKEETVIQKIKNFIAKIVAMQEEARKEAENSKAEKEKAKNGKNSSVKDSSDKEPVYMLEYYDLPYRYNETIVKILAQTPKRLFVYWDISDNDKQKYLTAFGERFFEDTYPVLLVHNEEKNYTFEVPINDFANSWYLDIQDSKSNYVIQLGRKFKSRPQIVNIAVSSNTQDVVLQNDYVPIITSNVLEVPNDHILFENLQEKALYRNVKTNEEFYVEIANTEFAKKMGKIYNIYDLYKEIYKNEIEDESLFNLLNPSSMSSSKVNK